MIKKVLLTYAFLWSFLKLAPGSLLRYCFALFWLLGGFDCCMHVALISPPSCLFSEIVDGNVKMTLGMIWTIILRFAIQDISVEGKW